MVEHLFNEQIKSIQSDGDTEFKSLGSLLTKEGVLNKLTYSYALKHNDVVECWHRYIVECDLGLLYIDYMPKCYWPYVMSTTTYFLNKLPSKVLSSFSPFKVLFCKVSDYSLWKVFGLIVFSI